MIEFIENAEGGDGDLKIIIDGTQYFYDHDYNLNVPNLLKHLGHEVLVIDEEE